MEKKLPKQLLKKGKIQRGFAPKAESPVDNDELMDSDESILNTVERELERDGIVLFDNENIMESYLRLPADLTEVVSRDLGRYFNTFTQQKVWVRTNLSRVTIMSRELESNLDDIRQEVYSDLPVKMSIKEKELQLRDRAKELIKEIDLINSKKIMLSDYLDSLIDVLFVISREVSRREYDWHDEKRENNLDNSRRR